MVNYNCPNCNKEFKKKSNFIDHVERKKKPCIAYKAEFAPDCTNSAPISTKLAPECTKSNIKNDNIKSNYMCNFCNLIFTRSTTLKRHLIDRCKIRKEENKEKEEILQLLLSQNEEFKVQNGELKKRIEFLEKNQFAELVKSHKSHKTTKINTINNTSISNINNGIINNITIEFNKEDLDKIDNTVFYNAFLKLTGAQVPSGIIEGIHFNEKFKEYNNVYISDNARNKALIYKNGDWSLTNADELVSGLLDKAIIFSENRLEKLENDINEKTKLVQKKIKKEFCILGLIKGIETCDYDTDGNPLDENGDIIDTNNIKRGEKLNEKAKENIKLTLFNNRNKIKKNNKDNKDNTDNKA